MITLTLLLALNAHARNDASSAAIYEYLASKGYEVWRTKEGGYVEMQTFSCNSNFIKEYPTLPTSHQCWYSANTKARCHSDEKVTESDDAVAKPLYEALSKMGLPIMAVNNSAEKWSQIDADNLSCMMTISYITEPASKSYMCWAMKKLKN